MLRDLYLQNSRRYSPRTLMGAMGLDVPQQFDIPSPVPVNPMMPPAAPMGGYQSTNMNMPFVSSGKPVGRPSDFRLPDPQMLAHFQEASAATGVPLNELLGIGFQESRFNQADKSGAGAIGVMQLMPGTARMLGVNPFDVRQNIMGGARYYAQMKRQFGGNVLHALAAYNAGPGRVSKWLRNGGNLPYETQDYMRKVPQWQRMFLE